MRDQLTDTLKRGWAGFRAFSTGQKAVTIAAVIALAIGGIVYATWKSSPAYAPLYTNLAPADASAIVDKLNAGGVPYQLAAAGTEIMVPQSDVYSARLQMSAANLPSSSQSGYALLDKEGVTTSQFQQQIDYQRAMEGELDNTIQSISGVQSASVHLAIPQQNVFNDGSAKPTASVLLGVAPGTSLTSQQVQSIGYLVSSSVPGMTSGNVTITDSNGAVLSAPGADGNSLALTASQQDATQQFDNRLSTQLQTMIDAAVGTGHSVVTVNAALDFSKQVTTRDSYLWSKKTPAVSSQKSTETYTGGKNGSGGSLGTQTTNGVSVGSGGTYRKTTALVNSALGTEKKTTETAPGGLSKLSVAVLLDKSAKNVSVPAVTALVQSALGLSQQRGDTLKVAAIPFDNSAAKAAAAQTALAAKTAAQQKAHQQLVSMIKQGALGAVVLAVVIGTWLGSRRRRRRPVEDAPVEDLFAAQEEPVQEEAPVAEAAPQLASVSDLHEAAARRRALMSVAENKPDDAARLLSSWLRSKEG
jgi:flagellar M-ring protein FliF